MAPQRRSCYEDQSARNSILAGARAPRPDALTQTGQIASHKPLADGAGHTFLKCRAPSAADRSRDAAGRSPPPGPGRNAGPTPVSGLPSGARRASSYTGQAPEPSLFADFRCRCAEHRRYPMMNSGQDLGLERGRKHIPTPVSSTFASSQLLTSVENSLSAKQSHLTPAFKLMRPSQRVPREHDCYEDITVPG